MISEEFVKLPPNVISELSFVARFDSWIKNKYLLNHLIFTNIGHRLKSICVVVYNPVDNGCKPNVDS